MTPVSEEAARELLTFYAEAGVDALVAEAPVNRYARADTPAPHAAPQVRAPEVKSAPAAPLNIPASPDAAALAARDIVEKIATLEALRAALDKFEGCALRATATQLVFADGNPEARVMLVGEAPGRD